MEVVHFKLKTEDSLKAKPSQLRGFFAERFPGEDLIHQYNEDGECLYRYPRIQYKLNWKKPFILGIKEGADLLKRIYDSVDFITIDDEKYEIKGRELTIKGDQELKVTSHEREYKFETPWLALNQKNYEKYNRVSAPRKVRLLNKILIGNILSMCKSLGFWIEEEIKVDVDVGPREIKALHFQDMLGFQGKFKANFELPKLIGLGRQVSKGFGTVKKCE